MNFTMWVILFCLLAALVQAPESAAAAGAFHAQQAIRSATIRLDGPLASVFPLFTPIGEKAWAHGWDPKPVWPESGEVVEGMVFTVDETPGRVFWVVTHYDPAQHRITYANVLPGQTVNRITIVCRAADANHTECLVRYAFVGLSEDGNRFVEMHSEEAFAGKMKQWTSAINGALARTRPEHH